MQDIPVLLHLFFWYVVFYEVFPPPRQALKLFTGAYLCNRGLIFAVPEAHPAHGYMALAFVAGCVAVWLLWRWAKRRQEKTGQPFPVFLVSLTILLVLPLATWLLGGAPLKMNVPAFRGFNFQGGITLSPEFAALLLGLVLYTAAFVAEIVRAGIQAISRGDHSTPDQSDVECDQEQFFSCCHRLSGLRFRGQHDYQSDWPGN
jgi:general L-amino acid transport system permease protein